MKGGVELDDTPEGLTEALSGLRAKISSLQGTASANLSEIGALNEKLQNAVREIEIATKNSGGKGEEITKLEASLQEIAQEKEILRSQKSQNEEKIAACLEKEQEMGETIAATQEKLTAWQEAFTGQKKEIEEVLAEGGSKKARKTTRKTKAIKGGKKTTSKAVKTTQRGRGRPKGSKNKQ